MSDERQKYFKDLTHKYDLPPMAGVTGISEAPKQEFFLKTYADPEHVALWDIGRPQEAIVRAETEGLFKSQVLDVGCGQGDNAVYLASKGYQVTAVDLSQHALDRAAKRAEAAKLENGSLILKQVDMLDPSNSALGDSTWDSALDSALLHCFGLEQQRQYLTNLAPHMKTGARLVLFCASDANKDPWIGPMRITEQQLREHFQEKNGWKLEQLAPDMYECNPPIDQMLAWRAVAVRV